MPGQDASTHQSITMGFIKCDLSDSGTAIRANLSLFVCQLRRYNIPAIVAYCLPPTDWMLLTLSSARNLDMTDMQKLSVCCTSLESTESDLSITIPVKSESNTQPLQKTILSGSVFQWFGMYTFIVFRLSCTRCQNLKFVILNSLTRLLFVLFTVDINS